MKSSKESSSASRGSLLEHKKERQDFLRNATKQYEKKLVSFGCYTSTRRLENEVLTSELRRMRRTRDQEAVSVVSLQDINGMLRWSLDGGLSHPTLPALPGRRGLRRGVRGVTVGETAGDLVDTFKLEALPPNQITSFLEDVDKFLTPKQGLFTVNPETFVVGSNATKVSGKKILLFVHGTFSNSENIVRGMIAKENPAGLALMKDAANTYDQILAFSHPTLSASPMVNALDLARLLRGYDGAIDVVCHSRGGVVSRWWSECFDEVQNRKRRIFFVGSPLAGTSLAAPARLKETLDVISNIATAIGTGASVSSALVPMAAPLMTACKALMRLVSLLASGTAKTPLLDAGMSLVPGLAGQSAVGNNQELTRLRRFAESASRPQKYFFVKSNFESEAIGWRFWKALRQPILRITDTATDVIFRGKNDLVVDTESMTSLAEKLKIPKSQILDFGTNDQVHHLNYFLQPETIHFMRKAFEL